MSPPACPPPQSNSRTVAIRERRKRLTHRAEAVKGTAMKAVGRLTGNGCLRARGRRDRAKGNIKQYGAKVRDALKR